VSCLRLFSWFLCCVFLLYHTAALGSDLERRRRELQEVEEKIQQLSGHLQAKAASERSLKADLELVETTLSQITERVQTTRRKLDLLATEKAREKAQLERTTSSLVESEKLVRKRLAALYKRTDGGGARLLFSGAGAAQVAEDLDYFSRIVRRDRIILAEYRQQIALRQQTLSKLETLDAEERELLSGQQQEAALLRTAVAAKDQLLTRVRSDKQLLSENLRLVREQAQQLAELINKLESEQGREYIQGPTFFATQKGTLPWPARGTIRTRFGPGRHPDLGTAYQSQGIELKVAKGQSITAVWPGRVAFSSPFRGYGNLVIIDHGEGYYTLYAQLSGVTSRVGDSVRKGDPIAAPGGDAGDRVYFEIRKGSNPIDPAAWLAPR